MTNSEQLPLRTIDWTCDAVWVQRHQTLRLRADLPGGMLELARHDGTTVQISADDLGQTHIPTEGGTVFKLRPDPAQAFRPRAACCLTWAGQDGPPVAVADGAALLRFPDGRLVVVSAADYRDHYAIVAAAGPTPPR